MVPDHPARRGPESRLGASLDNSARDGAFSSRAEEPCFTAVQPGDEELMDLALAQARAARDLDEVPIGAIIVLEGEVIGRGHNRVRTDRTPLAHAELEALRAAVTHIGDARLPGAVVYTTVEPCYMCAGALSHARVARVVWGVRDDKFGGCASLGRVLSDPRANHRAELVEGVRAEEAKRLLQSFFQSKREARPSPE
jgi:tRNA(adenine34) deaminase